VASHCVVILVKLWSWASLDQNADVQPRYINIVCCFCNGVMNMRFWTLSVLFHLGFFAAFLYLKPDLMRTDLREKIYDDVLVVGFVYEAPVEKDNISLKPIETEKQIVSKSLREQVRLVSKNKVLPKPARESVRAVATQVPEGPAHSATKIFEAKKANAKKYQRVASGVPQLNGSSVKMAAASIPVKSSTFSAPLNKTCISKSRLGAKRSREQNKSKENQKITIINLVGMHPAHRAVLQGQAASISALLGNKPLGRQPNIAALLNGGKNQSAQIRCK